MADPSSTCAFLGNRTIVNLASIKKLKSPRFGDISGKIYSEIYNWLVTKFPGGDSIGHIYLDNQSVEMIKSSFKKCTSENDGFLQVAKDVFDLLHTNYTNIDEPMFFGREWKIRIFIVASSIDDGADVVNRVLDSYLTESEVALEEIKSVVAAREEKQREFMVYISQPDVILSDYYSAYKLVSYCYKNRLDYALKYVDDSMMSDSKAAISFIERKFVNSHPDLDTEKIWEETAIRYPIWRVDTSLQTEDRVSQVDNLVEEMINDSITREYSKDLDLACKNSVKFLALTAKDEAGAGEAAKDF